MIKRVLLFLLIAALTSVSIVYAGGCLTGTAPSAREVKRSEDYVTISIALNVKSACDKDTTALAKVQAVDKDGFELDNTYLKGPVPKGTTQIITGLAMVEKAVAARIVRWQLQSLDAM